MTATAHDLSTDPRGATSSAPLAALFDAHCAFVWRSLRHLGVEDAALDDAVQDVFVIAYRRWSTFRGASTPRTWLFGIARRVAWRHRRAAHVHASRHVSAASAPEPSHEPFERVHAMQSLSRLLGRLDRDKRAVFVLAELEGLTAPEVSEALGIPLGTAYSRLRAAWQTLGTSAAREDRHLRRTLALARSTAPTPERRERMWAAIAAGLPALGPGGAVGLGAALAGVTQTHAWIVVIVALGIGLVGAAAIGRTPGDREARSNAGARTSAHAGTRSEDAVPPSPRSLAIDPGARAGEDAGAPAIAASSPARVAEPSAPRRPAAPSDRRPEPAPPPDAPGDALKQELVLVRAAKQALAEGRLADALADLRAHARRFPQGQLAADREALEASARKMQPGAIDPPPADTSAGEEPER